MIEQLRSALQQLATAEKLRNSIGRVLTTDQQVDISKIIARDGEAFTDWTLTDAGRRCIQDFADKFIAAKS